MAHINDLGPGLNGLEQLHAMLAGDIRPGIARVLGIRLVAVNDSTGFWRRQGFRPAPGWRCG